MSKDSVANFMTKLESDPELLSKLSAIDSSDSQGVINFANELGFEFKSEDFSHWPAKPGKQDLSDEDLDAASGGKCCACCCCTDVN